MGADSPPPARADRLDTRVELPPSPEAGGPGAPAEPPPSDEQRRTAAEPAPPAEAPAPLPGRGRRAALVRITLFAAATGALFFASLAAGFRPSPERLREWGEGYGLLGPLVFVPLSSVLNCVLIPVPVLAAAAGLIFGTGLGTPVALCAIVTAASMQMAIGRYLAGDQLGRLLPSRVRRFDEFLERRGLFAVLYLRLIPGLPFTTLNFAAGLTRLRLRDMAAGTAAGSLPRAFGYVALGGSITNLSAPEAKIALALLVAAGLGGALLARRQLAAERRGDTSPAAPSEPSPGAPAGPSPAAHSEPSPAAPAGPHHPAPEG